MARWAIIDESEQVIDYRTTGDDFTYDPDEYGSLTNGNAVMRPVVVDAAPVFDSATHERVPAPIVEVLPDEVRWHWTTQPRDPSEIAEEQRINEIQASSDVVDIVNRLKTANAAQIDNWIDTNVTTLPAARAVLKAIVKLLAFAVKGKL